MSIIVQGINGNLVTGRFSSEDAITMNEVVHILTDDKTKLKAEVIRIKGNFFDAQVFEDTKGVKCGNLIELSGRLLSIELGPGLLGGIFDGLGNPLKELSQKDGLLLKRGSYIDTLQKNIPYEFQPLAKKGDILRRGYSLGKVKEGLIDHLIMTPFGLKGDFKILDIVPAGSKKLNEPIASIEPLEGGSPITLYMHQKWPVKIPLQAYAERLLPSSPLLTRVRIVDAFFPIAEGGTACIPGPFGSGKTVFQQSVSRYGDADIVIIAACGERAGEVVETLREFPELIDPKNGRSLMERTIIICNTSSMPVAAREASIYTAVTIAEYYRQMGLKVLMLADSTSRWAQAIREMSGRLEEIPGEEAFPAYLGSAIAQFYERAGKVRIDDKITGSRTGSLTIIGTVSPAGGNFEEPVTQSTLAVVGCFLGLTYARSYAKRFPAIAPLESWSKYLDSMHESLENCYGLEFVSNIKKLKKFYERGQAIYDQMKVVGEEDISIEDYTHFHKAEFFDAVFLQQNAFDEVDASPNTNRVAKLFKDSMAVIEHDFGFINKSDALKTLQKLTSLFRDQNLTRENEPEYQRIEREIGDLINHQL